MGRVTTKGSPAPAETTSRAGRHDPRVTYATWQPGQVYKVYTQLRTVTLIEVGDGERLWELLNDPAMAILGPRRLVRPHGRGIAWNPADERCGFFQFTRSAQADAVTVRIHALSR